MRHAEQFGAAQPVMHDVLRSFQILGIEEIRLPQCQWQYRAQGDADGEFALERQRPRRCEIRVRTSELIEKIDCVGHNFRLIRKAEPDSSEQQFRGQRRSGTANA